MKVDLSTETGYIIATALRGPDAAFPGLKYVITGWIRGKCGVASASSAYCTVRCTKLTDGDIANARHDLDDLYQDRELYHVVTHWTRHSYQAIELLCDGDVEKRWLLNFLAKLETSLKHPNPQNKAKVHKCLYTYKEVRE